MRPTGPRTKAAVGRIAMAPPDVPARNKAVVRRYVEVIWDKEDLSKAGEVVSADFQYLQTGSSRDEPKVHRGVAGLRRVTEDYRRD